MKTKRLSLLFMSGILLAACTQNSNNTQTSSKNASDTKWNQQVNVFIGTGGHGHTFPGAAYPFGQIQLSPDNGKSGWDWCSGYHYSCDTIAGFSHLHLSGTGCADLTDISFMPVPGDAAPKAGESNRGLVERYQTRFNKKSEKGTPGYYEVKLNNGILAELTTTERVGYQRYTFPKDQSNSIILNLGFSINGDKVTQTDLTIENDQIITGMRRSNLWAKDQHVYFAARFSSPIKESQLITTDEEESKVAFLHFDSNQVIVKVAVSSVSVENALQNLDATDKESFDFDTAKKKTEAVWAKHLSKIKIEPLNQDKETIFYSALYHTMIQPALFSDLNHQFKGVDGSIQEAKGYDRFTTLSLWDTYRTEHPLLSIIEPSKANDMIKTMIDHYEQTGTLPIWELQGYETGCMVGIHGISAVAEAICKDLGDFDKEKAYEAIKKSSLIKTNGWAEHDKLGYVPTDKVNESVAKGMEYCVSDYAVALAAKKLGKMDDYKYFLNRSRNYKNYFDTSVGFMRGKLADGTWRKDFIPTESRHRTNDYTEGTAWQYLWLVPQDPEGLIELVGGEEAFAKKMDQFFALKEGVTGKEASADISGMIGGYAHGNEPGHHTIYMYNFAHKYNRTQEMLRKVYNEMYRNNPDGLSGNEDCGQMSAWYVMSSLGFYPVHTSTGQYQIGLPDVKKAEITLENGKTFTILASTLSQKNCYIQSVKLNGKELNRSYITHQEIMNGGTLEFMMSDKANPDLFK